MAAQRRWPLAALLIVLVTLAAGCGSSTNGHPGQIAKGFSTPTPTAPGPFPDAVRVVRTSTINSFPPLDRAVTDPSQAQGVYAALYGLPTDQHPPLCGNDTGLMYQLTFSRQGSVIGDYVLHAAGCPYLSLSPSDRRGLTDDFWALLSRMLGVSVEELQNPHY